MLNLGRSASFAASPARLEQDDEALPGGMSGPLAQGREFVWSNRDFARVQALIYKRAGISLHDTTGKHQRVTIGGEVGRIEMAVRVDQHLQSPAFRLP